MTHGAMDKRVAVAYLRGVAAGSGDVEMSAAVQVLNGEVHQPAPARFPWDGFHRLWGKAADAPGYVKEDWVSLFRAIQDLEGKR